MQLINHCLRCGRLIPLYRSYCDRRCYRSVEKPLNPRIDCLRCIGRIYCCEHYHIDHDEYQHTTRRMHDFEDRVLQCKCEGPCQFISSKSVAR